MTARFLHHLREWDDRICNPETDQWHARGGGHNDDGPMRFEKSEPRAAAATQWTINNLLGDDPLLRPLVSEVRFGDEPSGESSLARAEV